MTSQEQGKLEILQLPSKWCRIMDLMMVSLGAMDAGELWVRTFRKGVTVQNAELGLLNCHRRQE